LPSKEIRILGIPGIPEIQRCDDLGGRVAAAIRAAGIQVAASDVFVVAQKIVSKAEGRQVRLDSVKPSERALGWARDHQKDARVIELVLRESRRIVRMERGVLIAETHHGFICANAGVDVSNTPPGTAALLPENPDRSASLLLAKWESVFGVPLGVIIADTFGRPWREGLVNVAIGLAGLAPLLDYRGQQDAAGYTLQATVIAVADELASAGELVMGKTSGVPVALIRGWDSPGRHGASRELIRPPERDLFR
jgi:coenzyme F420-0:L-glutamate ligase / coenzyme F420-1:gamma-L-glutamate ligase